MPEDGSKTCPVALYADEGRRVELAIRLEKFERVADQLVEHTGMVTGSVHLCREQGRIIAEVTLDAQPVLRCQRCLKPMALPISSSSRVVLLESEDEASNVPPELETALAPDGRLKLADLVEEELLLALPAAPRHPEGQCPARHGGASEEFSAETQRPFAGLAALLGTDRSKQ